jgi:hypothetical protein
MDLTKNVLNQQQMIIKQKKSLESKVVKQKKYPFESKINKKKVVFNR